LESLRDFDWTSFQRWRWIEKKKKLPIVIRVDGGLTFIHLLLLHLLLLLTLWRFSQKYDEERAIKLSRRVYN